MKKINRRTLDLLVTEKVMGWHQGDRFANGNADWFDQDGNRTGLTLETTRPYSFNWRDMGEVLDRMGFLGYRWKIGAVPNAGFVVATFNKGDQVWERCAHVAPLAVALAALDAVGVDITEWHEFMEATA